MDRGPQFWHGSDHEFNEGDTVEPGKEQGLAFASTNQDYAGVYGKGLYEVEPIGDDLWSIYPDSENPVHASPNGFRVIKRHR